MPFPSRRFAVLAAFLAALCSIVSCLAAAPDAPGAKDTPQVKRVTGSQIVLYKFKAYDEMNLPLEAVGIGEGGKFKDTKRLHVEGAHTILYYLMPVDVGTLEVVHQYASELKEQHGAEALWAPDGETPLVDPDTSSNSSQFVKRTYPDVESLGLGYFHFFNSEAKRYASFKGKNANGGDLYVSVFAFPLKSVEGNNAPEKFVEMTKSARDQTMARVDIIETKPMAARMSVVKAEEITDGVAKTGHVAIYGVYFDTDKADLKPESKDALTEMAQAIKAAGAGKKFLIVGHTDNQGAFEYNQTLSARRAKAVTEALARDYGLAPGSVVSVGVGMAAPVASNADEAGRAKNRRVEIVAM